jgi:hypothetical protein
MKNDRLGTCPAELDRIDVRECIDALDEEILRLLRLRTLLVATASLQPLVDIALASPRTST